MYLDQWQGFKSASGGYWDHNSHTWELNLEFSTFCSHESQAWASLKHAEPHKKGEGSDSLKISFRFPIKIKI